eukprot:2168112-Prymnesium_polylepis.1
MRAPRRSDFALRCAAPPSAVRFRIARRHRRACGSAAARAHPPRAIAIRRPPPHRRHGSALRGRCSHSSVRAHDREQVAQIGRANVLVNSVDDIEECHLACRHPILQFFEFRPCRCEARCTPVGERDRIHAHCFPLQQHRRRRSGRRAVCLPAAGRDEERGEQASHTDRRGRDERRIQTLAAARARALRQCSGRGRGALDPDRVVSTTTCVCKLTPCEITVNIFERKVS